MKLGKVLKKILDLLPLNGSKLSLGRVFALFAVVQQFASWGDLWALLQQLTTTHLSGTAVTLIVLGWLHKQLKKKYPDTPDFKDRSEL